MFYEANVIQMKQIYENENFHKYCIFSKLCTSILLQNFYLFFSFSNISKVKFHLIKYTKERCVERKGNAKHVELLTYL